jgi:23S rRNA (uracil1939-C5)-methyltransferase
MTITLTAEKLVFGGQALARAPEGQVVFIWNALPGETVEVEITKKQKTHWEGNAIKVLSPSPERVLPVEDHYMSCSPWQILSWEKEQEYKRATALETYKKIGHLDIEPEMTQDERWEYGYRNKMEYSFAERNGQIVLAFFERGTKRFQSIEPCKLADPLINKTTEKILVWINKHKIPLRSLRAVIVRSNLQGKTIAALFIKDEMSFPDYPEFDESFGGFRLYFSNPRCPAAIPTKLLYSAGEDYLSCRLKKYSSVGAEHCSAPTEEFVDLEFGLLSFFQVHIPLFEYALKDMGDWIIPDKPLLDLYSGVGSIGLPLADRVSEVLCIDNNAEAIEFAKKNIEKNGLKNGEAVCSPSEKITEAITSDKTVILDPPRAGLHKDVTQALLEAAPERILYLSCNISTQSRDVQLLLEKYKIVFSRLYNFFPRTPHVEGLVVLEKYE